MTTFTADFADKNNMSDAFTVHYYGLQSLIACCIAITVCVNRYNASHLELLAHMSKTIKISQKLQFVEKCESFNVFVSQRPQVKLRKCFDF